MAIRSRSAAVLIALGLAAFLLVAALPASAHYPYKLSVAVQKAYAPKKVKMNGPACKKTFGNQLYALVAVKIVKTGKASTLALQFINTAGWFSMWKGRQGAAGGREEPASERREDGEQAAREVRLG